MSRIHIFCQPGQSIESTQCCYGAMRATFEIARYLQDNSRFDVKLWADRVEGQQICGIDCAPESEYERDQVNSKAVVIGISRGDCFRSGDLNVVYHHGPHFAIGFEKGDLNGIMNLMICVSEFSRRQQIGFGIPSSKIHVVPNGIDANCFYPRDIAREPLRFLYAGQIRSYKGVAFLLEAFELALQKESKLELLVCGENRQWTISEQGHSWLQAKGFLDGESKIDWNRVSMAMPAIKYLGEKSPDELAMEYSRSAYLICPSIITETYGLVSLEAQACGCIPILANHGGYLETLVQGCPRIVYHPWQPDRLTKVILSSAKKQISATKRNRIAMRARQRTWGLSGGRFLQLLENQRKPKNKLRLLLSNWFQSTL